MSGSLTQLYTVIKKISQENQNTILVDAEDTIQRKLSRIIQR